MCRRGKMQHSDGRVEACLMGVCMRCAWVEGTAGLDEPGVGGRSTGVGWGGQGAEVNTALWLDPSQNPPP